MMTIRNIKFVSYIFITIAALLIGNLAMAIEKAGYKLLEREGRFEIRQYEAHTTR